MKLKSFHSIFFLLSAFGIAIGQINSRRLEPIGPVDTIKKVSALTALANMEKGRPRQASFLFNYYGVDPEDHTVLVEGILKKLPQGSLDSFKGLCTEITSITGDLCTFTVPLARLSELVQLPEVTYVSLTRRPEPQIQMNARHDVGLDKVHAGTSLPMPYTGKGVLTGLVDVGIEYSNPMFKNEAGDSLRIVKAWIQNRKSGTSPPKYKYGSEFTGPEHIEPLEYDSIGGTHGTLTAAAMAGSGYGSSGKYRGAAPNSNLIMISSNYSDKSLLNGMTYFFEEAKKLGKRAVFNLSWGSHLGPHDGTSLFDQAVDSVCKQGGVVVGAAGNWGSEPIHFKHRSNASATTSSTVIMQWDTVNYSLIDLWGKQNSSFQVQIKTVNKLTGAVQYTSTSYSTVSNREYGFKVPFGKDTSIMYVIMTSRDALNQRPNCLLAIKHNHIKTNSNLFISITSSNNNEVHGWAAQNGTFASTTGQGVAVQGAVSGDNQYTVAEIGGTSKSIITVGAYSTQKYYRNIFGEERTFAADSGLIEPFSSKGPTLDGRIKPDITAPGTVISAYSRPGLAEFPSERAGLVEGSEFTSNGKTWYWYADEATSIAAPVVAGSAALLLQANPSLTFEQIRLLLTSNATTDDFTNATPNNTWGHGKLNIYKAISSAITVTSLKEQEKGTAFWYSNPIKDELLIFLPSFGEIERLEIVDVCGKEVSGSASGWSRKDGDFLFYDTSFLPIGQYVVILRAKNGDKRSFKLTKV